MKYLLWLQINLIIFINNLKGLVLIAGGSCHKVNNILYFLGGAKVEEEKDISLFSKIYSLDLSKGINLKNPTRLEPAKNDVKWEPVKNDGSKGIEGFSISSIYLSELQSILSLAKAGNKNSTINYYNIQKNQWTSDEKASNEFDKFVNPDHENISEIGGSVIIQNEINKDELFIIGGFVTYSDYSQVYHMKLNINKKSLTELKLEDSEALNRYYPFIITYKGALHYFSYSGDNINTKKMVIYNYSTNKTETKAIQGDNPQLFDSSFLKYKNQVYFIVRKMNSTLPTNEFASGDGDPNIYILNLDTFEWKKHKVEGLVPVYTACFVKHSDYLIYFKGSENYGGEPIQIIDTKNWKKVNNLPSKENLTPDSEIDDNNDNNNDSNNNTTDKSKITNSSNTKEIKFNIEKLVLVIIGCLLVIIL